MKIYKLIFLFLISSTALMAQKQEIGIASYYSDKFHGKPTASGALYNKNEMTGAHKTLPFGTMVKVTRLDNGKSVRVKITDRGPYISGRIVEVSRAAADKIGLIESGVAEVRLDIVKEMADDVAAEPLNSVAPKTTTSAPEKKETAKMETETPKIAAKKEAEKPKPTTKKPEPKKQIASTTPKKEAPKTVTATSNKAASRMTLVKGVKEYEPYGLYSIELKKPAREGYGIQVASLGTIDGAFRKIAELQGLWFDNILMNMEKGSEGEKVYKIILGPFDDEAAAQAYNKSLKKKKVKGFVVSLSGAE